MRTLKGAWGGGGNPAPVLPWYTRLATSQSQNKNLEGGCHSSQHWTDANTGRTKGHLPIFTRVTTKSQTLRRPKLITNLTELVPAVPGWDKLFSYSFQESNKNSKNKIERSIPPPQECGNFTNRKHSPRPSPGAQIVGWFPGERGCPPGFRLFRRGPRETRLQRALRVKLKEKKPPDSPTVAEGAKQWGISAQSGGAQRRLDFPSCLRSSSPEPGMLPQSAYTPPPTWYVAHRSTWTLKWWLGRGGRRQEWKGQTVPGRARRRGGQEKRPGWRVWSPGWRARRGYGGRRTGQRWREKWNAAPLRGLHGAQGPGASPPPPARRVGPFLGENHPQARSPEASLTPGPARPCPAAAAPPYPAVCRLLPALSDLLIFHLTRRFPSSPTPSPRLRPEARLRRGRRHARLYSMDPAPCQARKRHQARVHYHRESHLGKGQRKQKAAIFLKGNVLSLLVNGRAPVKSSSWVRKVCSLEPSFLRAGNYWKLFFFQVSRNLYKLQITFLSKFWKRFIPHQKIKNICWCIRHFIISVLGWKFLQFFLHIKQY